MSVGSMLHLPDYKVKFSLQFVRVPANQPPEAKDPKAGLIQKDKPPTGGWGIKGEEKIDWNRLAMSLVAPIVAQVALVFVFKKFPVPLVWNIAARYVGSIAAIFVGTKVMDLFTRKPKDAEVTPPAPAPAPRVPFISRG